MNTCTLSFFDLPVYRLFDELFTSGTTPSDKIDEGKQKIADGDVEGGEADILEGTAGLMHDQIKEKAEAEKEEDTSEEE